VDLPGDYNDDDTVNAADYVVWRENLGTNTTLPNDTTPGSVMQVDYAVWRENFGASGGGDGSLATAGVPEPAGLALATLGVIAIVPQLRSRRFACRI
jgi:hypothetical protein